MLKAVIFDYNGVLLNDLPLHEEAYLRAGAQMGFAVTKERVRRFVSYPPIKKRTLYYGDISDHAWEELFQLKQKFYFELAEKKNLLFPDVETVIPALAERYTLALISNTIRSQFEKTFPRELARLFQATLFADEVENPKPSPDPLRNILVRLGIQPQQCCYVGDAVEDVHMAKAANVMVLTVTTGFCTKAELLAAGAEKVFCSLTEIVAQFDKVV